MTLSLLKAEVWGACNFKCKNTGEPPQKFRGKSRGILLECFEGRKASGETVQREPSQLQAAFPVPGSLLNCKCKQTPARPPGSSPARQDDPFLGTCVPRGLQEWRVPPAYISGLTDRRFLLNSNCRRCH